MATKKKNSRSLSKKAQLIVKNDVVKSVAIASVLLNILFLVSIFVITSTDTFNRKVYVAARERYCNNSAAVKERATELGDETIALQERDVDCIGTNFKPFYQEAIDKFRAKVAE